MQETVSTTEGGACRVCPMHPLPFLYLLRLTPLNGVILHCRYKSRQSLPLRRTLDFHAHKILLFGPRFSQHRNRAQCLGVDSGHQIRVPGPVLLPKLSYLDFPRAHVPGKDSREPTPHCHLSRGKISLGAPIWGNLLLAGHILKQREFPSQLGCILGFGPGR
jgi:hypothetical protein